MVTGRVRGTQYVKASVQDLGWVSRARVDDEEGEHSRQVGGGSRLGRTLQGWGTRLLGGDLGATGLGCLWGGSVTYVFVRV